MRDDALIDSAAHQIEAARAARPLARRADRPDPPPVSLPGYELICERHRGGQGVVYEAIQLATKRRVAVKVLYETGAHAATQRRRFEREVEILSQFRHPNIVTVHDSGQSGGRFFYVMDLVQGVPLDVLQSRIQNLKSKTEEVLRLFAKICDALNAAHLRGVIHRDLKPGNILIDGAGEPRVLDFGLAKMDPSFQFPVASGQPERSGAGSQTGNWKLETGNFTETGQFVGSLPWSSPEQTGSATHEVDTRTDVYALGVLLYHGLTGRFPYRVAGGAAEVIDQIRNAEPQPMNEPGRRAGDGRSGWRIDNEVETIVRTCLQKDRERRYQSAGDLGRDIQRHLNHEPIAAKRDSLGYVLRKHLRRHRVAVGGTAAVIAACVVGLVVSVIFWRIAEQRRIEAQHERDQAREARQLAEQRRREADKVVALLEEMFGSRDAMRFPGPDATIHQMLDRYTATVFESLADEPQVEARLRATIGIAYDNLGEYETAVTHLSRAVELLRVPGSDPAELCKALNDFGMAFLSAGRFEEAERTLREALAVAESNEPTSDREAAYAILNLGVLYTEKGDNDAAEAHFRRAIDAFAAAGVASVDDGPVSARRMLGSILADRGHFAEAEPLIREALAATASRYPETDSRVAACQSALGGLLFQTGRASEAVPLMRNALAIERKALGERNPRVALSLANLGIVLQSAGELDDADVALRESLDIRRATLAPDHPDLIQSLHALADVSTARGRFGESEQWLREALAVLSRNESAAAWQTLHVRSSLGEALLGQGSLDQAETLLSESYAGLRNDPATPPAQLRAAARRLAALYDLTDRKVEADALRAAKY